eukprot:1749508-Pyramimonas_sp.AAC.1
MLLEQSPQILRLNCNRMRWRCPFEHATVVGYDCLNLAAGMNAAPSVLAGPTHLMRNGGPEDKFEELLVSAAR